MQTAPVAAMQANGTTASLAPVALAAEPALAAAPPSSDCMDTRRERDLACGSCRSLSRPCCRSVCARVAASDARCSSSRAAPVDFPSVPLPSATVLCHASTTRCATTGASSCRILRNSAACAADSLPDKSNARVCQFAASIDASSQGISGTMITRRSVSSDRLRGSTLDVGLFGCAPAAEKSLPGSNATSPPGADSCCR